MILDELICTNFNKFILVNKKIGHVKNTILYVKLSYMARLAPAKIHKVNLANQMDICERTLRTYILRLFVQGFLIKDTRFENGEKFQAVILPKSNPKLTINFKKLKKLEQLTDSSDAALLLSHIAYEQKYKHSYGYSLPEIAQFFCWSRSKVIYLLKRLEYKKLIICTRESKINTSHKINVEQINNIFSVDNFGKSVDKYAKPVDKSVDKSKIPESYPLLNGKNYTTKRQKLNYSGPLFLILRNIRKNIIINTECVEGPNRLSSYERAVQIFFINTPLLTEGLDRLKKEIEVGWETAEWLAQIRYSVLKTISKYPGRNMLNLICSCIKLACEKKWGVPSGFYESEEGRAFYAHIERQMIEHEERKWGGMAPDNPLAKMLHLNLPHMASMRPP